MHIEDPNQHLMPAGENSILFTHTTADCNYTRAGVLKKAQIIYVGLEETIILIRGQDFPIFGCCMSSRVGYDF